MAVAHNRPGPASTQSAPDNRSEGSSPPQNNAVGAPSQQQQPGHQRTYQACIPCRRRKVRCDLGSVDNPHDPPCKRCSRESKECFFSATRRKKKNGSGADIDSDAGDEAVYEIKNGRKRLRTTSAAVEDYESAIFDEDRPLTPGGSRGRPVPLRRPTQSMQYGEEDEKASEQTAAILQAAEVHGGHDALKVLYQAALRGRTNSGTSMGRPNSLSGISPASLPPAVSPVADKAGVTSYTTGPMAMYQGDNMWKTPVDPAMTKADMPTSSPAAQIGYNSALRAWSRFRFVRAGWLTAKEAIDYMDYFYQYLLPLTPVHLPEYRFYENHEKLLKQEPMLTVTILLIASRHMKLEGPGSQSRPYSIHQKLWTYLSGMIDRLVWGQEQFGGGFCGAGSEPGSDVNPLTRKGLRTLGTVESLILLTEWHPRAMHFPPDDDDDDLMMTEDFTAVPDLSGIGDSAKGIGGQRMDAWLEPCWRSDRMCWMLLGMAMSLSFEIGVFDSSDWQRHAKSTSTYPLSAEDLQAYDKRRGNVRELMLIYVTQTSGRLGLTSMLPATYSKPEDSGLYKRHIGQHESMQETILHFWLRMSAILREGNQKIFANKAFTRDLIRNGDYKAALDSFEKPLSEWRVDLDRCKSIPKYMRCILLIEFEYCRVYINALALQAVAERCANDQPIPVLDPPLEMARNAANTMGGNGERSEVAIDAPTLSKWLGGDRKYMLAVGDAARNLLKVVVDDLYPGEYLKHAPVRTYFRIISVAIMLLKSFSLGASESDVTDSLLLMDRTVEALRTCIVDDVHVASRFADLLDTLTTNLKPRLVRVALDGQQGRSRRVSHFNIAEAGPELQSANQKLNAHVQHQAMNGTPHPAQQWAFGNPMPSGTMSVNSNNAQSHPLYGISSDTYDLMGNDHHYSIMPPPSFGLQSPHATKSQTGMTPGANSNYDPYGGFGATDDWLALPLDPLLNITGAEVDQTMYGPSLGGQDMLELLLSGNNNQPNHGPSNGFG